MTSQYDIGSEHDDVIKRTTFFEKKESICCILVVTMDEQYIRNIFTSLQDVGIVAALNLGNEFKTQKNSYPICFYV